MSQKAIRFDNGVRTTETRQAGVKWYSRDETGAIVRLSDKNQRKANKQQRQDRINRRSQ